MTLYFTKVLSDFATLTGRAFHSTEDAEYNPDSSDLLLCHNGHLPDIDGPFRGTHIIRDPRDLIVSGYFYHLRTKEAWCTQPNEHNLDLPSDVSYQAHLLSISREDGLIYEMEHVSGAMIHRMAAWDLCNPSFLELRFEDVLGTEAATFERIFQWYEFNQSEIEQGVRLAQRYARSRQQRPYRRSLGHKHITPGTRIGQWKEVFTDRVRLAFASRFPGIPEKLGYQPMQS